MDRKAEIDDTASIGPYCVIDANVRIGAGCRLYHNVYVTGWTELGPNCELHPNAIVGHAPQDVKYQGERTYCRVGRGTILRENVTVHRGTTPDSETVVGESCFLLAGSHVGHNSRVGNRVTLINNVLLGGHVVVGDGVTIGGSTGVHQFVRIGELAMLAGVGRVILDVLPFAMADTQGKIAGINRIGLRRAGVSREEFSDIREAYRVLFDRRGSFREGIGRVKETVTTPAGRRLLEFLLAESKRGFAGRPKGVGYAPDGDAPVQAH